MLEIQCRPAFFTFIARPCRSGLGAKHELAEPEGESLLSHASRTVDEQARRKSLAVAQAVDREA